MRVSLSVGIIFFIGNVAFAADCVCKAPTPTCGEGFAPVLIDECANKCTDSCAYVCQNDLRQNQDGTKRKGKCEKAPTATDVSSEAAIDPTVE